MKKLHHYSSMCPHYFFKLNSHLLPEEVNACYEDIASDYHLLLSELMGAIHSELPSTLDLTASSDTTKTTSTLNPKTIKEEVQAELNIHLDFEPLYDIKHDIDSCLDDLMLILPSSPSSTSDGTSEGEEEINSMEGNVKTLFGIAHEALEKIEAYKDLLLTLTDVIDDFDL